MSQAARSEIYLDHTDMVPPHLGDDGIRQQLLAFAQDVNLIYARERARAQELESALLDLQDSYFATVQTLAFVVEAKDVHTRSHLNRAHAYAVALAERVAPELAGNKAFEYGFLLHDIGKIAIPEQILQKAGPLTDDEWAVMQTHPAVGAQILAPIKFMRDAVPIVESHHEQWDGSGYPRRLEGEAIPLGARVFSIVDAFDAMTSDRPYRRALTIEETVDKIVAAGGTQFDPDIVREFAALCADCTDVWPLDRDHNSTDIR
ncbi:MAG TPA: HD-GYP domain-containing protein [Actinomycetota bacterium]|nr:HD-GYP domain-containing protein [Actinomycetota bacterium]